jgi:formylglycine-generating enzyme required for sulfatase activity
MTAVHNTCVDRWEAHLVQVDAHASVHPGNRRPKSGVNFAARSAPGMHPQGYINRSEAASACAHAGKRLCTAREWLDACRGPRDTLYPYGNERIDGRCNTHKPHVPVKVFGRHTALTTDHYNSPRLHEEPGFLALTGIHEGCVNDYGLYDMVGNLHEWVSDNVSDALTKRIPLAYGKHLMGPRGSGVFMGGYFSSRGEHGRGCRYTTTNHAPGYHDYSIGFRCCADPVSR